MSSSTHGVKTLRMALRAARVGLWDWDLATDRVAYSAEWKAMLGYAPDEIGDSLSEWAGRVHPDDLERVERQFRRYLAAPTPEYTAEFRMRHKDGVWRWILTRADVIREDSGKVSHFIGADIDVSREHAAAAVPSRLDRLVQMTAAGNRAMIRANDEESLLREVCGIVEDVGRFRRAWVTPPDRAHDRCGPHPAEEGLPKNPEASAVSRRLATVALPIGAAGESFGTLQVLFPEDEVLDSDVVETLTQFTDNLAFGLGALRIRAERDRTAEALRESHRRIEEAQDIANLGYWDRRMDLGIVRLSHQANRILGFGDNEATFDLRQWHRKWLALVHPDDRAHAARVIEETVAHGVNFDINYRIVRPDGEVRHIHGAGHVIRDASGSATRLFGTMLDVTDRRRAEETARAAERRLADLMDAFPDFVSRFDHEGRFTYISPSIMRMTRQRPEDVIGKTVTEVHVTNVATEDARLAASLARVIAEGRMEELTVSFRTPLGPREFQVRHVPERDAEGRVVGAIGIAIDQSERLIAERALLASEQRFRQVTEAIDEVFRLVDVDQDEIIYVSPAYERVFSQPAPRVGDPARDWFSLVIPEDRERVRAATPLQVEGRFDIEYRIRHGDGVRWIHDRAFPIKHEDGRVYRIAGIAMDVTERRQLEQQLRQAQKLEAVGQLAGGIAHDFNNILAIIQMESSLLLDGIGGSTAMRDDIKQILSATERAANLTRQLLTFSRRQISRPTDLDLQKTIAGISVMLERILGEDVLVRTEFAANLPAVHADAGMMEQVVMNLAVNSRDAMPGGGTLTIALDVREITTKTAGVPPDLARGDYVRLTVADTGCGIARENLSRIFEPFFTTKEVGRGTGLGLATVFGIVQQHKGFIEVESTIGVGTTFRILLPAIVRRKPVPDPAAAPSFTRGGKETILLVEDDTAVRTVTRAALERFGYTVLEAPTAAAAMTIWTEKGPSIDLLLTDLVMPGGRSGRELAEALLRERPTLRVIYSSGYSPDALNRLLCLDPGKMLLQKPYSISTLAESVRRALA